MSENDAAPVSYQKQPRQNETKAIESERNAAKSTGPINILPLITVWLQVRVLPGHQQINGRRPLIAWMSHRTRNAPLWSIVAVV